MNNFKIYLYNSDHYINISSQKCFELMLQFTEIKSHSFIFGDKHSIIAYYINNKNIINTISKYHLTLLFKSYTLFINNILKFEQTNITCDNLHSFFIFISTYINDFELQYIKYLQKIKHIVPYNYTFNYIINYGLIIL
jgi:hypothetical protein